MPFEPESSRPRMLWQEYSRAFKDFDDYARALARETDRASSKAGVAAPRIRSSAHPAREQVAHEKNKSGSRRIVHAARRHGNALLPARRFHAAHARVRESGVDLPALQRDARAS